MKKKYRAFTTEELEEIQRRADRMADRVSHSPDWQTRSQTVLHYSRLSLAAFSLWVEQTAGGRDLRSPGQIIDEETQPLFHPESEYLVIFKRDGTLESITASPEHCEDDDSWFWRWGERLGIKCTAPTQGQALDIADQKRVELFKEAGW